MNRGIIEQLLMILVLVLNACFQKLRLLIWFVRFTNKLTLNTLKQYIHLNLKVKVKLKFIDKA
jgi:hypothetical protein